MQQELLSPLTALDLIVILLKNMILLHGCPQPRSLSPELESELASYFYPKLDCSERKPRTANYRSHLIQGNSSWLGGRRLGRWRSTGPDTRVGLLQWMCLLQIKVAEAFITPKVARWARERIGISPAQLADALGADAREIEAWERGQTRPPFGKAQDSAKTLKVPFGFLFLMEPPPEHSNPGPSHSR